MMKPLYIATSQKLAKSRQFMALIRLINAKCTQAVVIKLFNDKFGSISMNSEPIGTVLYFRHDHTIKRTASKLRRSKRLTVTQLEKWRKREEAIEKAVLEEARYYAGHPGSIH